MESKVNDKDYQVPQVNTLVLTTLGNQFLKPLIIKTDGDLKTNNDRYGNASIGERSQYLGTVVDTNLILESPTYEIQTYNETSKKFEKSIIEGARMEFETVLVDISQTKNIVTTSVNGRNGTVKEYISDGDYSITIRGAIVNDFTNAYPKDDVTTMKAILTAPVSLKCTSYFLNLFSIFNLVVTDFKLPTKEGGMNTQLFEISAISDYPFELSK